MTRKHYIVIADALAFSLEDLLGKGTSLQQRAQQESVIIDVITNVARALKASNPNFDGHRFVNYVQNKANLFWNVAEGDI